MWTSDNNGCIYLNGSNTGNCTGIENFGALVPFSITTGFQAGINTLDFLVTNTFGTSTNPTGVIAEVSGTASPISAVPEPSCLWLVGAGLLATLYIARQRQRTT